MLVCGDVVYAQTWQVLTLKNFIEPLSYASTAYFVAWPQFPFDCFVKIWATCKNFWANGLPPPLAKNCPYAYAYYSYHTYYTTTTTLATASTLTTATTLTSLGSDHDMSVVRDNIRCFTSVSHQRIGEERRYHSKLAWLLGICRQNVRFPDFPTEEQKISRILCPNFGEYRFPGNSQIPFPVKIF